MKLAKTITAVIAYILIGAAIVMFVAFPVIDYLFGVLAKQSVSIGGNYKNLVAAFLPRLTSLGGLISGSFSPFAIAGAAAVVILLILFIVAVVMLAKKKLNGVIGLVTPLFVLGVIAALCALVTMAPGAFINGTENAYQAIVVELKIFNVVIAGVAAAGIVFAVITDIICIAYAASIKVDAAEEAEEAPVDEEAEEAAPAPEAVAVEPAPAPVVAEKAPEAVAKEEPKAEEPVAAKEEPVNKMPTAKRHILVHSSGKVVRVLDENYYDVTTNMFIAPGFEEPQYPFETEQQHFERLIAASKTAPVVVENAKVDNILVRDSGKQMKVVNKHTYDVATKIYVDEPAEEPAPAPAPVKEEAAPVKEEPAPAPVVEAKERAERIPFAARMKGADKALKAAYNEIKAEILSYGIKSRVSSTGDTFRLHTKEYVKMVIAGKSLKMYFALNPDDYKDSPIPVGDASKMNAHKETPLVFKVKSDLSIRRAKALVADAAAKDGLVQGEVVAANYAKELQ